MSQFYIETEAEAAELLDEFGRDAVLRRPGTPTGPGYDQTPGVPQDYPIRVVDVNEQVQAERGSLVERHARKLYLRGAGVEPDDNDTVVMDSKEFAVISVLRHAPGGIPVLYEIEIQR